MRRSSLWGAVYNTAGWLYWIGGAGAIAAAACLKADANRLGEKSAALGSAIAWIQGTAWITIITFSLMSGLGRLIRRFVGAPWVWEAIHHLLDQMQRLAFQKLPAGTAPPHHHRATLFKSVPWYRVPPRLWSCRRWLVPVERSGHTTRECRVAFKIPDRADDVEGVAGRTWALNQVHVIRSLPDLWATGDADEQATSDYAKRTYVSPAWVRAQRPQARSYCGIPVEVRGRLWGVLVLDSRDPGVLDPTDAHGVFTVIGRLLSKLLERT